MTYDIFVFLNKYACLDNIFRTNNLELAIFLSVSLGQNCLCCYINHYRRFCLQLLWNVVTSTCIRNR